MERVLDSSEPSMIKEAIKEQTWNETMESKI